MVLDFKLCAFEFRASRVVWRSAPLCVSVRVCVCLQMGKMALIAPFKKKERTNKKLAVRPDNGASSHGMTCDTQKQQTSPLGK